LVYIQRYAPRYRPQFRYRPLFRYRPQFSYRYVPQYVARFRAPFTTRYMPHYMARYMPRFRKLFQNRWDALVEVRRQQRGAYTPEEWKMRLADIQKRRRVKK